MLWFKNDVRSSEVVGMRAGGRRELIAPPSLTYDNNKRMVLTYDLTLVSLQPLK